MAEADATPEETTAAPEAPRTPGPAPRPPRSPEERATERLERRRKRAASRRSWRAKQKQKQKQKRSETPSAPPVEPVVRATGRPRERRGVVVSDKADKTITVRIDVTRQHRVYKKTIRESSTLHAHDEANSAHTGDSVRVIESRPRSATKRWRLVDVLERAR